MFSRSLKPNPEAIMSKVYFSCPKFTVLLVTEGPIIVEAAPIVKRFEGQTIGALTSWARVDSAGRSSSETAVEPRKQSNSQNQRERRPTVVPQKPVHKITGVLIPSSRRTTKRNIRHDCNCRAETALRNQRT